MLEAVYLRGARRAFNALSPEDQAAVEQRRGWLDRLPELGSGRTITVGFPRRTLYVFDDGQWRIDYHVVDNRFIEIAGIRRVR